MCKHNVVCEMVEEVCSRIRGGPNAQTLELLSSRSMSDTGDRLKDGQKNYHQLLASFDQRAK